MVLAVLVAFGAVVGAFEGVKASQHRARREEHRSRKNNLSVHCPKSSAYSALLEGRRVVLSGGRLYVDTGDSLDPDAPFGHPFAGYYLPYPDARYAGLVSTITDVAPIMNWVFVDRASHALCYGARAAAEGQLTGPWDCTRQDRRMTFGGWEGFVAVRQAPPDGSGNSGAFWELYFDCAGDRLQAKLAAMPPGTVAVEVELHRREMRTPAPLRPEPTAEKEEGRNSEKDESETKRQETQATQPPRKSLTIEQMAELQRRLQEEADVQRQKRAERQERREREEDTRTELATTTEYDRPATPEGQITVPSRAAPDTDGASRRSRRSRCSRRGNRRQGTGSTSPGTSPSNSTGRGSSADSKASKDSKGDTDDGYTSSVPSNFFDSPRSSTSPEKS